MNAGTDNGRGGGDKLRDPPDSSRGVKDHNYLRHHLQQQQHQQSGSLFPEQQHDRQFRPQNHPQQQHQPWRDDNYSYHIEQQQHHQQQHDQQQLRTPQTTKHVPPFPVIQRNWWDMTRTIWHYERIEQVGEGTYGQVYKARCKDTNQIVALKKIRVHHGGYWGLPPTVLREIKILKRLSHPNLVQMLEVVSSKGAEDLDKDDAVEEKHKVVDEIKDKHTESRERWKGNIFLVLEYVSHDLTGLMDVAYRFTEVQIKCIFKQLLEALQYMHDNKYIHRDIKSSNILIDHNFRVKLADFGLARSIELPILDKINDQSSQQEYTNKVITLWYRPPELLMGETKYGPEVDIWSTGCILAELIMGKPLFTGKTDMEQLLLIFDLLGTPTSKSWPGFRNLKLIRTGQVKIEKAKRNKLREKYQAKINPPALNLIEKLLELDPQKRLTAQRALSSRYFLSEPRPPDNPEDMGTLLVVGGHLHEFQTKKKRREAKMAAEKVRQTVLIGGQSEAMAQEHFDATYREIMEKVAREGLNPVPVEAVMAEEEETDQAGAAKTDAQDMANDVRKKNHEKPSKSKDRDHRSRNDDPAGASKSERNKSLPNDENKEDRHRRSREKRESDQNGREEGDDQSSTNKNRDRSMKKFGEEDNKQNQYRSIKSWDEDRQNRDRSSKSTDEDKRHRDRSSASRDDDKRRRDRSISKDDDKQHRDRSSKSKDGEMQRRDRSKSRDEDKLRDRDGDDSRSRERQRKETNREHERGKERSSRKSDIDKEQSSSSSKRRRSGSEERSEDRQKRKRRESDERRDREARKNGERKEKLESHQDSRASKDSSAIFNEILKNDRSSVAKNSAPDEGSTKQSTDDVNNSSDAKKSETEAKTKERNREGDNIDNKEDRKRRHESSKDRLKDDRDGRRRSEEGEKGRHRTREGSEKGDSTSTRKDSHDRKDRERARGDFDERESRKGMTMERDRGGPWAPDSRTRDDFDRNGHYGERGPFGNQTAGPAPFRYGGNYGPHVGGPDFRGADHFGPDFRGPEFRGPDFRGPEFRGPDFRGPEFRGPDFHGPNFRGPDFRGPRTDTRPPPSARRGPPKGHNGDRR